MKKYLLLIGVLSLMIFSACGGGGGGSSTPPPPPPSDSNTTPPPPPATSITHNGTTYGFVTSPYTGKVWLDRNLGAARVCESFDDVACYGDYYQWGRNFDGHQDSTSGTTDVQATNVNNAGNTFIISLLSANDWDWAKAADASGATRSANWSRTDGSSVCPVGFRVPSIDELRAELFNAGSADIQNRIDAFNSFLRLPSAGLRWSDSNVALQGVSGWLWSSSVNEYGSIALGFDEHTASLLSPFTRANGNSVRCIKN